MLLSNLTEKDKIILQNMIGSGDHYCFNIEHFLRYWNKNKTDLFHILGNNFVIRKSVEAKKTEESLRYEMANLTAYHDFYGMYCASLCDMKLYSWSLHRNLMSLLDDYTLANNVWKYDEIRIPAFHTATGKEVKISNGMKIMRAIRKVWTEVFGNTSEEQMELYENFRIEHSKILNTATIKGNLCLSIHPCDFATVSDNDYNWGSCMSWRNHGEYRLGTIEMMNSPYVIVAYLDGHDGKDFYGKKWRQYIVITPDIIVGNTQYPYSCSEFEAIALTWVRELAINYFKNEYEENIRPYNNQCWIDINGTNIAFNLYTNYMYNDLDRNETSCFVNPHATCYECCISGPAVCCECGELIEYHSNYEPDTLICPHCRGYEQCPHCGDYYYPDDMNYIACEEQYVCNYCAEQNYIYCNICDKLYPIHSTSTKVMSTELHIAQASVCPCCIPKINEYYGELENGLIMLDRITPKGMNTFKYWERNVIRREMELRAGNLVRTFADQEDDLPF